MTPGARFRHPARHLARLLALVGLVGLGACGQAARVDDALRRIDVLDRVFEPDRFRQRPAEVARLQPIPQPPPEAPPLPKEPEPTIAVIEPVPEPVVERVPEPQPGPPTEAAPPQRMPTADVLRREPWLTRFWSELTPNQQSRVTRRLPQRTAERWDGLGLPERARLFGGV